MRRSLLFSVAIVLSCLAAGTVGFYAGRYGGPDLAIVARTGSQAGAQSGSRVGAATGRRAGFRAGYRIGFQGIYGHAYQVAYQRALGR